MSKPRNRAKIVPEETTDRAMRMKIVGIGGAGVNALASIPRGDIAGAHVLAVDTDGKACAAACAQKYPIGDSLTRGLSASGDAGMGRKAAEMDVEKLCEALSGSDVVVIVVGLGGGTGSGAAPIVAQLAQQMGALTLAVTFLPFEFEPSLRRAMAANAAQALHDVCDATLSISLDALFAGSGDNASADAAFRRADSLAAQAISALAVMLTVRGMNEISLNDLRKVWGSSQGELAFGAGQGASALEDALAAPTCSAQVLADAGVIFVHLSGKDLGVAETMTILKKLEKMNPESRVLLCASLGENAGENRRVTIFAGRVNGDAQDTMPGVSADAGLGITFSPQKRAARLQQQTLELDTPTRGRFEKTEATIYEGEDLDVPTFIRKNVRLS